MTDKVQLAKQNVEAFGKGDWAGFKAPLSEDSIYAELATQRRVQGPDAIVELSKGWRQAFPDAKGTITKAVESGDTVVLEITWEGTQSGPLQTPEGELPPSNRQVTVKAAEVFDVEGDKVKEAHHYFDMAGMLQQLGASG